MATFEKLKERIKKDLGIDAVNFKRLRPGYWQRTSGAWSWVAQSGAMDIGSQFSATEILKSKTISIYKDGSIFPE